MSPIRNIPKVELHLHLEGAVRISTLKELSILKGITGIREPRSTDKDEYEPYREFYCITKPTDSLSSFIVLFTRLGLVLNTPDVLERITFEVIELLHLKFVILPNFWFVIQWLCRRFTIQ
jgi:adenosine deaminase